MRKIKNIVVWTLLTIATVVIVGAPSLALADTGNGPSSPCFDLNQNVVDCGGLPETGGLLTPTNALIGIGLLVVGALLFGFRHQIGDLYNRVVWPHGRGHR